MLHRFVFQKKARLQFDSICDYLGYEFGTKTAEDFVSEVEQCVATLTKFPESGHIEQIKGKTVYRSRIIGKYNKMYYYLRGNTLVIAAFADMRMHPDNVTKAVIGKP